MAHECEACGQYCYCDCDDTGGLEQPSNCRHFTEKGYCESDFEYEDADEELIP